MQFLLFEVKLVRKGVLVIYLKNLKEMLIRLNDEDTLPHRKRTDDGWDIDALHLSDSLSTVTHKKQHQEV